MPVIRRSQSENLIRDAIVLDLGDLQRQAEHLLEKARVEADQIRTTAEREAAKLIADASKKGYAEGVARGEADGKRKGFEEGKAEAYLQVQQSSEALTASWSAAIRQWEEDRGRLFLDAREDVLALALAIAEKVVHRAIALDGDCVKDQIEAALSSVARRSTAQIHIHPDDRTTIEAGWPEIARTLGQTQHVELKDDPSVDAGGCRVVTDAGVVDATVRGQIARIVETLLPDRQRLHPLQSSSQEGTSPT